MEQLDKFIFQENKIVTPEFLCEHAQVSLVEAKSFMEIFYEVHKGTNGLWATFMAFGTIARSGVRIETTVVFRDADMERVKEEFEEIIKMELLSLQVVEIHNRSPNHPREEGEEIDEQNSTENRSTNDGDSISSGDILPPNDSPEWSSSTTPEDDASDNERPKSSYSWGIVSPDNSEVDSRSPPPSGTPEHVSPIQNFLDCEFIFFPIC
ncbi:hypothetical protein DICVIV_10178 [Dictyocaulus viviparus]|uniref:Uncharacterized protein n=1 Tax=Dictyocaulus viviparus TaxID=29172 RepID=A0A0D8XN63_DICVI|nr:hypothetical protein DICVIV_10178 [Dictyocaulus viviparus]